MPTETKEQLVAEIKERFNASEAVIMVDYRGLTVKQMQALRGKMREAGSELKIYKNSLTEIAIRELALPSMDEYLAGPTAFVFVTEDAAPSAKALNAFARENKALELKGGFIQNQVYGADGVKAIATLPSREELISMLLGTWQNPMVGFARVCNGPVEAFARTVQAVADQQEAA